MRTTLTKLSFTMIIKWQVNDTLYMHFSSFIIYSYISGISFLCAIFFLHSIALWHINFLLSHSLSHSVFPFNWPMQANDFAYKHLDVFIAVLYGQVIFKSYFLSSNSCLIKCDNDITNKRTKSIEQKIKQFLIQSDYNL